jgi:predicted HD phosphohydrolase
MTQHPRSPLFRDEWEYVEKPAMEDFGADDWQRLNAQRASYVAEEQARQALRLLTASARDTTFGYQINNYRHCLQSASLVMEAGHDEETIVVALFHDVGFTVCPDAHGAFAAELLGAYVSEANDWMLRHHAAFQLYHCRECPSIDRDAREQWRDHPHFQWTAEFVEKYDQNAIRPDYREISLDVFEPMVQRVFARSPHSVAHGYDHEDDA